MNSRIALLDSITDATPDARDRVAVCGSHGGLIAAALASSAGLRAVVLNDAGGGLKGAGTRGVMALDTVGMAAAAIDCMSARIGSAQDTSAHGVLSTVNETARALGLHPGQSVADAVPLLLNAAQPGGTLPAPAEARFDVTLIDGAQAVLCVDSASLITAEDAGRLIVTGSHGGLIGADPARACKAQAGFVAFNDAGIGKDRTGLGRLEPLGDRGIAAAVLHAASCEIGDAASALETGRISAVNAPARALGVRAGSRLRDALDTLLKASWPAG